MLKNTLVLVLALSATLAFARDLSAVHGPLGLKSAPAAAQCLACHGGSYPSLAQKTKSFSPNPHATHMADVQCDACHRWTGEQRLMCNDCHRYPELEKALTK